MATTAAEAFDAVVVGSGAGGGAAAYALCRAGWKVLVLEKGPHYTEADFFHDELAVCRRDTFVPSPLDEPQMVARAGAAAQRSGEGWISCCVGGGTVHMSGFFFRMHPEDFRLRTRFGDVAGASVADWPLAYEDMEPFYEEVERVIGVSGDGAGNPLERRRAPYPLPPLLAHPAGEVVDAACKKLGLRSFRTPRAIISADYGGRQACQYCGFCASYGCEVGAKSSSLATFLALAAHTGKLTLRARSMTAEVTAKAGRATGVVYLDAAGARHAVRAHVVVLACSAVQSARLLLASRLANGSGLLGKNLMFATMASGYARFPRNHPAWPAGAERLPFIDRTVQDYYLLGRGQAGADTGTGASPHPKGGTILFMLPHKNPIFAAERLATLSGDDPPAWGAELRRRMREYFHESRTIEHEAFGESLPHDACRVSLDPDVKDRYGLPVARIDVGIHPASMGVSDLLAARAREVLAAADATEVGAYRGERVYFPLQCGTARMGTKPAQSVLDPTGQAHDVHNLYVADGSGFPSSSGAPFTLTIMANALRVASHIVRRGASDSR